MSALRVKCIHNATQWDLTALDIQCRPKYKCSSYTKEKKEGEMINYLLNESRK